MANRACLPYTAGPLPCLTSGFSLDLRNIALFRNTLQNGSWVSTSELVALSEDDTAQLSSLRLIDADRLYECPLAPLAAYSWSLAGGRSTISRTTAHTTS